MRFDIIRAWKDEGYRQSLSDEQLSALTANPAGEMEMTNEELASGWGGQCCGGGFFGFGTESNFHSLAFECNEALFSFTTVAGGFNALSPITPICINDQD